MKVFVLFDTNHDVSKGEDRLSRLQISKRQNYWKISAIEPNPSKVIGNECVQYHD